MRAFSLSTLNPRRDFHGVPSHPDRRFCRFPLRPDAAPPDALVNVLAVYGDRPWSLDADAYLFPLYAEAVIVISSPTITASPTLLVTNQHDPPLFSPATLRTLDGSWAHLGRDRPGL